VSARQRGSAAVPVIAECEPAAEGTVRSNPL
jgi:hypothetical protein